MEKTCKTCKNLEIVADANGGLASDRSSANIRCSQGYFGTQANATSRGVAQPGTYAPRNPAVSIDDQKAMAFNIAVQKYEAIPTNCTSYKEGTNAYYKCLNCRNAIVNKNSANVLAVVGCQVKSPIDSLPIVKIIYADPTPGEELTPVGCEFFSPDDVMAKPFHLAEVIKLSLQTFEQRIAAKYNSRTNKLPKTTFISLVKFYNETNTEIYLHLAQQSNSGEELTAANMAVIEKAMENAERIHHRKFAVWKGRLDHLLGIKEDGFEYDIANYRELLLKFGYLSVLQEQRLQQAEVKEYGSEYSKITRELKESYDPETRPSEIDLDLLNRKTRNAKFRRRSAWGNK